MLQRLGMRAMRAGVAAACAMAALGALAQGAPTPQAALERAQSTGVLAGLQRAVSTPLEIVWLRTAAEFETWTSGGLAGATVGRTGWRYIFGGNAQFAPAPNEVARLVVSSLRLPRAPVSTGTLDLSGSGRLFIISPEAPDRAAPAQMALVLAAGSTLQVSDTASPGLQIEIKAPERRPLVLGNLASASVRRMLAFLVKPDAVSASAASMNGGKVALHAGGEIELAAVVDDPAQPPAPPIAVAAAPAPEVPPIAVAAVETPLPETPPAETPAPVAVAVEAAPVERELQQERPLAVATVEPVPTGIEETPAPAEVAMAEPVEAKPAPVQLAAIEPEPVSATPEPTVTPPIEETPATPIEAPVALAAPVTPVETPAPAVQAEPVPAKPAPVAAAPIPEKPVIAIIESSPPPAATPQQAASIARMRAEIEAEIERDRERLAHQHAPAAPDHKRFVFGV